MNDLVPHRFLRAPRPERLGRLCKRGPPIARFRRASSPLAPVLGGEGLGVRGLAVSPEYRGEGNQGLLSRMSVTGPSFVNSTCIIAPKRPVAVGTPSAFTPLMNASYS